MIEGMYNWMKYLIVWAVWLICVIVNPVASLTWTFIGFVLGHIYFKYIKNEGSI